MWFAHVVRVLALLGFYGLLGFAAITFMVLVVGRYWERSPWGEMRRRAEELARGPIKRAGYHERRR